MRNVQNHLPSTIFMALILAWAVTGCDSETAGSSNGGSNNDGDQNAETETYDVMLEWQIEGDYECVGLLKGEAVSFDKVTIDIYQEDDAGDRIDVQYFDQLNCLAFEYTVPRLPSGDYLFAVRAWATYEEEQLPFYEALGTFNLEDDPIEPLQVSLSRGKGSLEIQWGFDNSLQCQANLAEEITIAITDVELGHELETITLPCDSGSYIATDLRWSRYTVVVEGFGAEAETADWSGMHGLEPIEVRPGQRLPVPVIMSSVQ